MAESVGNDSEERLVLANFDDLGDDEIVEMVVHVETVRQILSWFPGIVTFPIPYDPELSMPSFGFRPRDM